VREAVCVRLEDVFVCSAESQSFTLEFWSNYTAMKET